MIILAAAAAFCVGGTAVIDGFILIMDWEWIYWKSQVHRTSNCLAYDIAEKSQNNEKFYFNYSFKGFSESVGLWDIIFKLIGGTTGIGLF